MRLSEHTSLSAILIKTRNILAKKENLLTLGLGIIVFCVAVITKKSSFYNANAILIAELLFLLLYIIILRELPPIKTIVLKHRLTSSLFLSWLASIIYSLVNSPYNLVYEPSAQIRFAQIITHIATFIFLWDFFNRYKASPRLIYYLIPISTLYVVYNFILASLPLDKATNIEYIAQEWFRNPPYNSHIRHTGYQAAAALSVFVVYFVQNKNNFICGAFNYLLLVILWAFIFWLGGRTAILSCILTAILIWLILIFRDLKHKHFIFSIASSVLFGAFIAEWFAVFSWNGIVNAFHRTLEADSLNAMSTNRILIWNSTWESVKDHLIFGLGPQGYYFMPTRIYGVQPHSILLQFIVEWGLVGALLFLLLMAKGFWYGLKTNILGIGKDINQTKLISGAIISVLTIYSLIDGTYYHPQPSFYLAIAFAVWIIPYHESTHRASPNNPNK